MARAGRPLLVAAALLCLPGPAKSSLAAESAFPAPLPSELERQLTESASFVKRVRVEGAASLAPEAIALITRTYENRVLTAGDVRELQQRLTRLYIDSGYVTSGVIARDPVAKDGELVLLAIEGAIAQVRFRDGPRWSRPQYLTRLLVPDDTEPVRLEILQERLAALRDAGVVDRINAELVPLPRLGETELVVDVEEPLPFVVRIDYDNHHSPTIGARRPTLYLADRNVSGWGDILEGHVGKTEGLKDALVSYALPVPKTRLRIGARWERSDSLAISPEQFRSLDIKALSITRALEASWAIWRRASNELAVFGSWEKRSSDTTLLGIPFSFVPGIEDGRSRETVVRGGATWSARGEGSVSFARLQASRGSTNVMNDASADGTPARTFRAFFAQGQYARRLPWWSSQIVVRAEGQYTPDVLLPLERYALGGSATVRGYRENLLLRDRALLASVELQTPITRADATWRLSAAVFSDAAWSRNTFDQPDGLPRRISSAGVGLIANGPWGLSGRLYAARPAQRWLTPRDDVQDRGVHFLVSWEATRLVP